MFILTIHWDLRALFAGLTITSRSYVLGLMVAALYSTCLLVRMVFRLYRGSKNLATDDDVRTRLVKMASRVETLRQLHTLLFLLFGVCCANEVAAILRAIQYSSASLSAARMDIFEPVTAFAFFAFAVLLVLHIFQWAMAARLRVVFPTKANALR
jgi:hypothetical protein